MPRANLLLTFLEQSADGLWLTVICVLAATLMALSIIDSHGAGAAVGIAS